MKKVYVVYRVEEYCNPLLNAVCTNRKKAEEIKEELEKEHFREKYFIKEYEVNRELDPWE